MRWLLQARRDLDDARYSFEGERFSLACFLSRRQLRRL
ncbi:MAG: HEPN domain-containing protein [Methanotrichaceae archaeon]|nr:HEPN domain-containing protein [Methanotrichaceae archaeon]